MSESEINSETTAQTPGVMLKKARIAKGLSISDVSSRLCLSHQFIEDIENDNYSRMSAQTYARGYVRAYARIVDIPDAEILSALENVTMDFPQTKKSVSLGNEQSIPVYQALESSQQRSSLLVWGTILVVIILIGLLVMWWQGPKISARMDNNQSGTGKSPTEIPLQPQSNPSPPQQTPGQPQPLQPQPQPQSPRQNPSQTPLQPQPPLPQRVQTAPLKPAPKSASADHSVVEPADLSDNTDNNQTPETQIVKPDLSLPEPRETANNNE